MSSTFEKREWSEKKDSSINYEWRDTETIFCNELEPSNVQKGFRM